MPHDSTTDATVAESRLTEEDAELFRACCEQLFALVMQPGASPILLNTHQHLNELRQRIVGEED